eukprot:3239563-Alexandrium_andersonii.AAC.1
MQGDGERAMLDACIIAAAGWKPPTRRLAAAIRAPARPACFLGGIIGAHQSCSMPTNEPWSMPRQGARQRHGSD